MFKSLAKQLVQELDSDRKLIPVRSLAHSHSFQPLSLVTEEQFRLPWRTRRYSPTAFKLADVLQEGAMMEIELKHSDPILFTINSYHKSGARLTLKIKYAEVDIGGLGCGCLSASPVYVRKTYVDTRELGKTELSLNSIQRITPKLQLYVVTEVFEIMKSLLVDETVQIGGKGEVSAMEILKIQALNVRVKKKSMLIPQGTVIAYGVEKLQAQEEDPGALKRTLFPSLTYDAFQDELGSSLTAVQHVKDAVKEAYEPLMYLSQALKRHLLESFVIVLQDRDVASTVQSVLELSMAGESIDHSMLESLDEELCSSVEMLLSRLGIFQDTEREENRVLWGPMHFLCSSLDDLDYEMLPLLETIVEKKDMGKQLEMMNGVLEWILSGDEGGNFTIPSDSLMDEADLTTELLQNCGLDLEAGKDSITCRWNKEACSELAALYSSLYALAILSG
ncbi:gasdermin-C-like [Elgaria multicarinata webbii]|uniref:gasdermin-C-like n=1 Tax=Elgaria multicarinata webbii TaxID=159646 RepID=UPI002FCD57B2